MCSTGLVVQEAELKGILSPAAWQHLVFSYVESLDGSTLTGTVSWTSVNDLDMQTHDDVIVI